MDEDQADGLTGSVTRGVNTEGNEFEENVYAVLSSFLVFFFFS